MAEYVPDYNTGNYSFNNLMDGSIRFFIKDESCKKGSNMEFGKAGYKKMPIYKQWRNKLN